MSETATADTSAPETATPPAADPGNLLASATPDTAAPDGEAKPAEGEAKPAEGEEAERVGAPEAYEWAAPEGQEVNAEQLDVWKGYAKEAGLTQKQFAALTPKAVELANQMQAAQIARWHETQKTWQAEVAADREIAGEAPGTLNKDASAAAARAIEAFGGDALKRALVMTGAGNHPALVRAFVQIGKAMGEGATIAPNAAAPSPSADAVLSRLYPSMR